MLKHILRAGNSAKGRDISEGFTNALSLFKDAAKNVPAYRSFLLHNGIDASKIRTLEDFETIPPITKENYLKMHQFKELIWNGDLADARVISMSSGSSGKPTFWPRGTQSIEDSVDLLEDLFTNSYNTREKNTLAIVAFAMGTWIAGTYMYSAMLGLADKGHKITTITPSINKDEVLRIIERIGGEFDQIILMGYPPLVKDIVDAAVEDGMNLKSYNLKLLFAGETFSEKWRDYVLSKIGKKNDLHNALTIYGTADAGIMGIETPLSVYIRKLLNKDKKLLKSIFPEAEIPPSLVQYNPEKRYTEEVSGEILFTVRNSLPLIRYNILDRGKIVTWQEMHKTLTDAGHELPRELTVSKALPFIALYGRPDVATTFYALNVYPENIKYGLEISQLQAYITGKFVVKTVFDDESQEQSLHIFIELKNRVTPKKELKDIIFHSVLTSLKTNNSEYRKLHEELKHKANPVIHLLEFNDPNFQFTIKHKWNKKT